MSRHRLYRNLDINDELDDEALSDGGEDEISPHQQEQLNIGLEQLRSVLGTEDVSGLSDDNIKDALWESWFSVDAALQILSQEQARQARAEEKKGMEKQSEERSMHKNLPPLPPDDSAADDEDESSPNSLHEIALSPRTWVDNDEYAPPNSLHEAMSPSHLDSDDRPHVPLIVLAQQRQIESQTNQQNPDTASSARTPPRRLSTISERTEHTEASRRWPSRQQLAALNNLRSSSITSSDTSYGQPLAQHPEFIPPSPSMSAIQRLSIYEPPPSVVTSVSRSLSSNSPPRPPSAPLPPMDTIPDIPDVNSKSSKHPGLLQAGNTPSAPSPSVSVKKSKLSMLASSRASSSSKSSRSHSVEMSSVATYPALRPSPNSEAGVPATPSSSTSSHVRRAIQTALDLEAVDKVKTPKTSPESVHPQSSSGSSTPRATRSPSLPPSPLVAEQRSPKRSVDSQPESRQPSKLALLAKAKAEAYQGPWMPKPKREKQPPSDMFHLPKPHTEHLTPIANGPTATLAITTEYQSLHSLASPSRSLGPLHAPPPELSSPQSPTDRELVYPTKEVKSSKLAMKIKKARERTAIQPNSEESSAASPIPPLFLPKTTGTRASPSAFASLLIDDPLTYSEEKDDYRDKKMMQRRDTHDGQNTCQTHNQTSLLPSTSGMVPVSGFAFDEPSPDDLVFNARRGTSLEQSRRSSASSKSLAPPSTTTSSAPAKDREKAQTLARKRVVQANASGSISASPSRTASPIPGGKGFKKSGTTTPKKSKAGTGISGASTPIRTLDQRHIDIVGLSLYAKDDDVSDVAEETPKMTFAREKLLDEARKTLEARGKNDKCRVSIVVIGHVDAGKSTLMGRLLYEFGKVDEKTRSANERASTKIGKGSFSWAWELDGTNEERQRGITMDIALQSLTTTHRHIVILDAPGHKDFIPNMISGASQADCAVLVIDAATGEFEAGFDRGGQTREHLLLVRSLGVSQVIVAINKLDQVRWEKGRYEDICGLLRPFLLQSGFHPSKIQFVPVGATLGVNLISQDGPDGEELWQWYSGPTLANLLDKLEPPARDIVSPVRLPISNVFRGQGSSIVVTGRLCSGVAQVGEKLRIVPGDETAVVKSINSEDEQVLWAAAGANITMNLTSLDPVHLGIGSVLCSTTDVVPLATVFTARIIVFDIVVPITIGASVELYHHSRDVPATISNLLSTIDRVKGTVMKRNPRVLTKGTSAEVQISLRTNTLSGPSASPRPLPLEPFAINKDMGRVLIRRSGETISAGIVLAILA